MAAAWLAPASGRAEVFVGFRDTALVVAPGAVFTTELVIRRADAPFNAFDASVRFDPAMLTFEATSPASEQCGDLMSAACSNLFHRFAPARDSLRVTLALLCGKAVVTGSGSIYRLRFRAGPDTGTTRIGLGPFTEFYQAGLFVRPLHRGDMVVTIARRARRGSAR